MSLSTGEPLTVAERLERWVRRARLLISYVRVQVGAAIMGPGWLAAVTHAAIVEGTARDCITPDGQVILAKCQPLADAIYGTPKPGEWTFTAARTTAPTGEEAP